MGDIFSTMKFDSIWFKVMVKDSNKEDDTLNIMKLGKFDFLVTWFKMTGREDSSVVT